MDIASVFRSAGRSCVYPAGTIVDSAIQSAEQPATGFAIRVKGGIVVPASIRISQISSMMFTGLLLFMGSVVTTNAQTKPSSAPKIYAQKLVEETLSAHPEIAGLEIAATPSAKSQCVTIASNDPKEIGEKCDKDEFTAIKTNKPFIEREKEHGELVYDATIPIHDSDGKIIGTAGVDFKPEPNQSEAQVNQRSQQIAKELESKIGYKEKLFEAAN